MIKNILKQIHNFFLLFGIDIKLVKNSTIISALQHNTKESMHAFYADPQKIKEYLGTERKEFYNSIIIFLKKKNYDLSMKEIADIGCGTGHLLLYISNEFLPLTLTGFEYADSALEIAKKILPSANFHYYNIYEESVQQFDFVFCTEVLEHLQYPDKALKNLMKMVKPGGVLFLTVPNGRKDTYDGHINFWSPESWDVFLSQDLQGVKIEAGLFGHADLYGIVHNNL